MGHGLVGRGVGEQFVGHGEDDLLLHARQLDGARLYRLRTLGLFPQDKHRLAQGGSLLLKAAGVGHHQMAAGHEVVHLVHRQRSDEVDAGMVVQILVGGLLDHRREVYGVDQLHLGEGIGNAVQGGHDVGHGLAVVFPAVAGDQDHLPVLIIQIVEDILCKGKILYHGGLEGVNDGVAGEEDPLSDILTLEVLLVGHGGAEVQVGNGAHHLSVHLLGEGRPLVVGAKASLHMAHGDLVVEGGQSTGEGSGGVAVDQNQVGLGLIEHIIHAGEALGGDSGQGLPGLHDVQVIVGLQLKNLQHAVQHLPVLGSDAAQGTDARTLLQLQGQGGHFDGLRPGAEDGHNSDRFHLSERSSSPKK